MHNMGGKNKSGVPYEVYRCIHPDNGTKYKDIGAGKSGDTDTDVDGSMVW